MEERVDDDFIRSVSVGVDRREKIIEWTLLILTIAVFIVFIFDRLFIIWNIDPMLFCLVFGLYLSFICMRFLFKLYRLNLRLRQMGECNNAVQDNNTVQEVLPDWGSDFVLLDDNITVDFVEQLSNARKRTVKEFKSNITSYKREIINYNMFIDESEETIRRLECNGFLDQINEIISQIKFHIRYKIYGHRIVIYKGGEYHRQEISIQLIFMVQTLIIQIVIGNTSIQYNVYNDDRVDDRIIRVDGDGDGALPVFQREHKTVDGLIENINDFLPFINTVKEKVLL